jgi:hypothetical protein
MSRELAPFVRWGCTAVTLLALTLVAVPSRAESGEVGVGGSAGRVAFDFPDAPAATVEIDLSEGMLSAIAGVGTAAIQGVAEALVESSQGSADGAVQQSAEHLQAVHEIFQVASNVIREVRIRVYEDLSEQSTDERGSMIEHYESRLNAGNWDSVIRVHQGGSTVLVRALEREQAIHGLFVLVSEGDNLVLANVVCELTPEKVKQVTSQATKIGMKFGLEEFLKDAVDAIDKRRR